MKKINFRKIFLFFSLLFLSFFVGCFFIIKTAQAGNEHNVWGWAWAETIGWISFNSKNCDADNNGFKDVGCGGDNASDSVANYGVHICESDSDPLCSASGLTKEYFVGYAWSESIGWIRFDPTDTSNSPGGEPEDSVQIMCYEDGTQYIKGWARACSVYLDACNCGSDCTDLKPETATGGWDGWILLSDGTMMGFHNPMIEPDQEFGGYAWGSDVIGWISFNCEDEGSCGVSDYRVLTSLPTDFCIVNEPPVALIDSDPVQDYCLEANEGWGNISFQWTYTDPDEDPQEQYRIQIDDDSGFSNCPDTDPPDPDCPVDCTITQSVDSGGTGTSGVFVVRGNPQTICSVPQYQIAYNTPYYWRIKVQDNRGAWSVDWEEGPSFTTAAYAYPWPRFTVSSPQIVGKPVIFTDSSLCYNPAPITGGFSNIEHNCREDDSGNVYYWWFYGEGMGDDEYNAPGPDTVTHIYSQEGEFTAELRISDTCTSPLDPNCPNRMCTYTHSPDLDVKYPPPKWQEASPSF